MDIRDFRVKQSQLHCKDCQIKSRMKKNFKVRKLHAYGIVGAVMLALAATLLNEIEVAIGLGLGALLLQGLYVLIWCRNGNC